MAFIPILPFRWNLYLPSICFHSLKFRLSHCIEEKMMSLLSKDRKKYSLIMETKSNLDFVHLPNYGILFSYGGLYIFF